MQKKQVANPGFAAAKVDTLSYPDGLTAYLQNRWIQVDAESLQPGSWNLVDSRVQKLLDKIKAAGKPLGEYVKGNIFYGIKTGLNEAFVIDAATRERLIAEDARSAEIIKPFLAGRDIKRYQQPVSDKYLLFIPWHFPLHHDNSISGASLQAEDAFQREYPAIYNHLLKFKEQLLSRNKAETGVRYEWYALQRCAATYFEEFDKPKIIIPAIVQSASYGYDDKGYYSNDKTSIIPTEDLYLLGVLNSKVTDFYLKNIASTKQNGYYEYKPLYVSQLPIVIPDVETIQKTSELISKIILPEIDPGLKTILDIEIDEIIFKLYNVTDFERTIIQNY